MNWLQKFMRGRYGYDQLSFGLLVVAMLLLLLSQIRALDWLLYFSLLPMALAFMRVFSRNTARRQMENYRFMKFLSPVYPFFLRRRTQFRNRLHYKYFRCPQCRQSLRVPRGKGKLLVTCPKCGTKTTRKS